MKNSTKKVNYILTLTTFFLIVLGIINGEYLRPKYRDIAFLNLFLGSLPNFIGSCVLSFIGFSFFTSKIFQEKNFKGSRLWFFVFGLLIFVFLTLEEYFPFFLGSKTYDVFDIIATAIGILFAYIYFVFTIEKYV